MEHIFQSGAELDIRLESEKLKDFKQEELVAGGGEAVNWTEKPADKIRKFPIFNQNGSGSCVAQTEAKEMGIMRQLKDGNYVHFSATDIYQRRANKPNLGMAAVDARKIAQQGVTLEDLSPSQHLSDIEMDNAVVEPYKREVGKVFAVPNYITLNNGDIEAVASFIQHTGKGTMVWFFFTPEEWGPAPVIQSPNLTIISPGVIRHSLCAVDFTLRNGEKNLVIEDSWGPGAGSGGQRFISEKFFKARNYYSGYLVNFNFGDMNKPMPDLIQPPIPKPNHIFNIDLEFGQMNDEVKVLQDCLRYEGLFPQNISSTGQFGAVTKDGVERFQIKYGLIASDYVGYGRGRVGPKTRGMLNLLYG